MNHANHNIDNYNILQQVRVIELLALIGMSITFAMALISGFNANIGLALTLLGASAVFGGAFYLVNKLGYMQLSSYIIIYSLYILMFYLIFTGGVELTGPLWIFIVPPVSLYIHGLKHGLINILIFVIVMSLIMFLPQNWLSHAVYSTEFKLRLLYSFITMAFLSALYEHSRKQLYNSALELSAQYHKLAHYDQLTGLFNRRNALLFIEDLTTNKEDFCILLCDIDYFKLINDINGHNAGDMVLVEISNIFTELLTEKDCVARWGGEEFLFVLPYTSLQEAYEFAEKARIAVSKHKFKFDTIDILVSVSTGIEQHDHHLAIDKTINNADKNLYQAKRLGRDQTYPVHL